MSEEKHPPVLDTDWDTINSLPPILKKVALELVSLGKIRIAEVVPGNTSPSEPARRRRE